jgi:hypothetical protein
VRFNPSHTELTTAATDAVLGLVCLAIVWALMSVRPSWPRAVWIAVFTLMAVASLLGAYAHGFDLSERVRAVTWQPLYLSLGLAIGLFVVAAVHDWRGVDAARALLPWALGAAVAFYALTYFLGGAFIIFVVYEGVAMLAALGIYSLLAAQGAAGATAIAIGIALSLVAAVVQATSWSLRLGVVFDHNGVFHLIQTLGVLVLAAGVRASLMGR